MLDPQAVLAFKCSWRKLVVLHEFTTGVTGQGSFGRGFS